MGCFERLSRERSFLDVSNAMVRGYVERAYGLTRAGNKVWHWVIPLKKKKKHLEFPKGMHTTHCLLRQSVKQSFDDNGWSFC